MNVRTAMTSHSFTVAKTQGNRSISSVLRSLPATGPNGQPGRKARSSIHPKRKSPLCTYFTVKSSPALEAPRAKLPPRCTTLANATSFPEGRTQGPHPPRRLCKHRDAASVSCLGEAEGGGDTRAPSELLLRMPLRGLSLGWSWQCTGHPRPGCPRSPR